MSIHFKPTKNDSNNQKSVFHVKTGLGKTGFCARMKVNFELRMALLDEKMNHFCFKNLKARI